MNVGYCPIVAQCRLKLSIWFRRIRHYPAGARITRARLRPKTGGLERSPRTTTARRTRESSLPNPSPIQKKPSPRKRPGRSQRAARYPPAPIGVAKRPAGYRETGKSERPPKHCPARCSVRQRRSPDWGGRTWHRSSRVGAAWTLRSDQDRETASLLRHAAGAATARRRRPGNRRWSAREPKPARRR